MASTIVDSKMQNIPTCKYVYMYMYVTTYSLSNLLILRELVNGTDVLISEAGHSSLIILLCDVVGLYYSCKHWKTISSVERSVIVVGVHTSQLLQYMHVLCCTVQPVASLGTSFTGCKCMIKMMSIAQVDA